MQLLGKREGMGDPGDDGGGGGGGSPGASVPARPASAAPGTRPDCGQAVQRF